jgi:hypothetical protein
MPADDVLFERDGRSATIMLNRPEKLNALTGEMMGRLHDCREEVAGVKRRERPLVRQPLGQAPRLLPPLAGERRAVRLIAAHAIARRLTVPHQVDRRLHSILRWAPGRHAPRRAGQANLRTTHPFRHRDRDHAGRPRRHAAALEWRP